MQGFGVAPVFEIDEIEFQRPVRGQVGDPGPGRDDRGQQVDADLQARRQVPLRERCILHQREKAEQGRDRYFRRPLQCASAGRVRHG